MQGTALPCKGHGFALVLRGCLGCAGMRARIAARRDELERQVEDIQRQRRTMNDAVRALDVARPTAAGSNAAAAQPAAPPRHARTGAGTRGTTAAVTPPNASYIGGRLRTPEGDPVHFVRPGNARVSGAPPALGVLGLDAARANAARPNRVQPPAAHNTRNSGDANFRGMLDDMMAATRANAARQSAAQPVGTPAEHVRIGADEIARDAATHGRRFQELLAAGNLRAVRQDAAIPARNRGRVVIPFPGHNLTLPANPHPWPDHPRSGPNNGDAANAAEPVAARRNGPPGPPPGRLRQAGFAAFVPHMGADTGDAVGAAQPAAAPRAAQRLPAPLEYIQRIGATNNMRT